MYFLYDDTGEYQGCTHAPHEHPDLNHTQTAPIEYDEFTQKVFYVDGAWEIREI